MICRTSNGMSAPRKLQFIGCWILYVSFTRLRCSPLCSPLQSARLPGRLPTPAWLPAPARLPTPTWLPAPAPAPARLPAATQLRDVPAGHCCHHRGEHAGGVRERERERESGSVLPLRATRSWAGEDFDQRVAASQSFFMAVA